MRVHRVWRAHWGAHLSKYKVTCGNVTTDQRAKVGLLFVKLMTTFVELGPLYRSIRSCYISSYTDTPYVFGRSTHVMFFKKNIMTVKEL